MPKIDMTNIPQKIVHVHRGKPIDLNIPIKAQPQPVCSWFFCGVKLKDSLDRIKIESNGKYTHLVIRETTINDTGNYSLEVKNAVGTAKEVIKVIILGKESLFKDNFTDQDPTCCNHDESYANKLLTSSFLVSIQTNPASQSAQ